MPAHCDGTPVHYDRHRSEQTTLYRQVQQHAKRFFAQAEEATGASLPQFVKDEFDAFLECGILAHGFLRLRCADCGHDKLVAFSCKRPEAVFTGFRTGEDLAACYASSDLLLFPSLTETFCNVTTEALANGLPLVAFNDAAAGQLVTHDLNAQCAGRSARPGVTEPMAQEPP